MPGSLSRGSDVPAYTEQAQLGYQGYFVYQSGDYTEGLGVKITRCSAGTERPYGVVVRGGEYAGASDPQSVVIRKQGVAPVVAGSGDLEYGDLVKTAAGGKGIVAESDGDIVAGRCIKGAAEDSIALVELVEVPYTLYVPSP